jgi:hypothetical protein
MTANPNLAHNLTYFIGSATYFQHFTGLKYTEGVQYLAKEAKAYWLIDVVGWRSPNSNAIGGVKLV